MNHLTDSVSRCRELIAVAVSQIDDDPIVGDRLVNAALEIALSRTVPKKIIALQRAGRRNPMTHENADDLTANILVGRSFKHRSTIGFPRHYSYGRAATVDKIAQPIGKLFGCGRTAASGFPHSRVKRTSNEPQVPSILSAEIFSPFGPQVQFASFTLFAGLGSVQRTARGHPNASTARE